jgi:hypothetical protein
MIAGPCMAGSKQRAFGELLAKAYGCVHGRHSTRTQLLLFQQGSERMLQDMLAIGDVAARNWGAQRSIGGCRNAKRKIERIPSSRCVTVEAVRRAKMEGSQVEVILRVKEGYVGLQTPGRRMVVTLTMRMLTNKSNEGCRRRSYSTYWPNQNTRSISGPFRRRDQRAQTTTTYWRAATKEALDDWHGPRNLTGLRNWFPTVVKSTQTLLIMEEPEP